MSIDIDKRCCLEVVLSDLGRSRCASGRTSQSVGIIHLISYLVVTAVVE